MFDHTHKTALCHGQCHLTFPPKILTIYTTFTPHNGVIWGPKKHQTAEPMAGSNQTPIKKPSRVVNLLPLGFWKLGMLFSLLSKIIPPLFLVLAEKSSMVISPAVDIHFQQFLDENTWFRRWRKRFCDVDGV
jgi:hypothetical protein